MATTNFLSDFRTSRYTSCLKEYEESVYSCLNTKLEKLHVDDDDFAHFLIKKRISLISSFPPPKTSISSEIITITEEIFFNMIRSKTNYTFSDEEQFARNIFNFLTINYGFLYHIESFSSSKASTVMLISIPCFDKPVVFKLWRYNKVITNPNLYGIAVENDRIAADVCILLLKNHPNIVKNLAILIFHPHTFEFRLIFKHNCILEDIKGWTIIGVFSEYIKAFDAFDYFIRSPKTISKKQLQDLTINIVNALCFLKDNNIFYRDLKPENILIEQKPDNTYNYYLIDFEFSYTAIDEKPSTPCGTVNFGAPELFAPEKDYDAEKNITYSLGLTLYTLAFNKFFYHAICSPNFDSIENTMRVKIIIIFFKVHNLPKILTSKDRTKPSYHPDLEDLLKHLICLNPEERFSLEDIRSHPYFCAFFENEA